jgi:hypothetical protein
MVFRGNGSALDEDRIWLSFGCVILLGWSYGLSNVRVDLFECVLEVVVMGGSRQEDFGS